MSAAALVAILAAVVGCGEAIQPFFTPSPSPQTVVLVGAGDIGECGAQTGAEATARLLDRIEGIVFTAGDNAYPSGRAQDFRNCYDSSWGRHKARTRPSPGNHDYETAGASDYFAYYGPNAGPAGLGYYSFGAGNWTVLSLNTNVPIDRNSAQLQWLRSELEANRSRCSAAFFHHPPFSSGPRGGNAYVRDLWRALHAEGVDVVIAGHEHGYERFAAMDGEGRPDLVRGTRLLVTGSGGARLVGFGRVELNSEVRVNAFGVVKLTLSQGAYQWEFVQADGGVGDNGVDTCH